MAQDKTKQKPDTDLEDHGVQEIIPEDEEYYTYNLKRDFDRLDEEETEDISDISGDDPLADSDDDTGRVVDPAQPEYRPKSSNQGGPLAEDETADEDNDGGSEVGEPGHWGVDEDTS